MSRLLGALLLWGVIIGWQSPGEAALAADQLASHVVPPMALGGKDEQLPVWQLLNSGGALAGYIFESRDLAPIPGFSGTPMNLLVSIDTDGNFLDIKLLDQNEPVFVSGLGPRPLHEFLYQYRGRSLATNIKVMPAGTRKPADAIDTDSYFDGVTKATASVRIANQTILAAALKVAREKLAHIAPKPAGHARQDLFEPMPWAQLIERGLVEHLHLSNRDLQQAFAATAFADDDPEAHQDPAALYLDLWIADLNIPSVAKNLLSARSLATLRGQLEASEEPILLLANGRHRLVAADFVRNSVPDHLSIRQQGFPISLRDADAEIDLLPDLPEFEQEMILRVDTRFGFDPASPWDFIVKARRQHGSFRPTIGSQEFVLTNRPNPRYFIQPSSEPAGEQPPWLASWQDKAPDLVLLALFLALLSYLLLRQRQHLTAPRQLAIWRPVLLLITLFFVGWWEQGQLSIVTLIGLLRAIFQTHNFNFLLYDPISLLLWLYTLITLVVWGRGTFCGWLCPFGTLQEFAHTLGRRLGIREWRLSATATRRLGWIKYAILAGLVASLLFAATWSDRLVEVEPFKTAITLTFQRTWPYVLYAVACVLGSMLVFKGYCRFLCPLGAALVLGGKLRRWDWLARRPECGTPCKLCYVTCRYDAIERDSGAIRYDDCFQCLECVEIHDDAKRCVPLIQRARSMKVNTHP
ncbi:4Fe-4S binding protein [Sedimenticola sp.]|uniref:4Fe-4S binding protein n=1 Tax=Sedimenticola sp. TaxID=1940285 RepID=UPI0025897748|nr:4Fe-4S binding protein [Sedimenticola sp.]MCW8905198.1 4Fe-4S binding protein [Sedimenticola sp.]